MAWKVERWLTDVFPGQDELFSAYEHLPDRELIIVACAVLDAALLELLSMRFIDDAKEAEDFLGADGDGRAPGATFGARIQLAFLLGLLSPSDVSMLRSLKNLRNLFAHRVKVGYTSKPVVRLLRSLLVELEELFAGSHQVKPSKPKLALVSKKLETSVASGRFVVLLVFMICQVRCHDLHARVKRVGSIVPDPQPVL